MTDTVQEAKPGKFPPMDEAARKHLYALLCEAADMEIALRQLLDRQNPEGCHEALKELVRAIDTRLAKSMNVLTSGKEEG